ncbi:MAG: hypothetical protein KIS87_02350 [Phycisphaeraceae bacterium]|nr:hypothetical protein [Phycisphaeraceae bacterium]
MSTLAMIVAAAAVAGASPNRDFGSLGTSYSGAQYGHSRLLATMPPYPTNRVDDTRRPGFNGRVWIGETFTSGPRTDWPLGWGDPGPTYYGADQRDLSLVYVRVGHQVVAIRPWIAIPETGLRHLENGRQEWLRERGFVGGVRTHIPDSQRTGATVASAGDIKPSATIRIRDGISREGVQRRVEAAPSGAAAILASGEPIRISWPHRAPAEAVERTASTGGWIVPPNAGTAVAGR